MNDAPAAAYRVGILPIPGFALMSYSCMVEPLRAANLLSGQPRYEIVHFGDVAQVLSSGVAAVARQFPVGATPPLDLLLVVAGGDPFQFRDADTLSWLRQMAKAGVRIGGVSGGPVVLARAGLLDGYRIAVHWEHGPMLAETHPALIIERRLFVIDRDRVTCGGGIAPLDLMHALITSQHGAGFARLVSDWFLHTDIRAASAPQRGSASERLGTHSPHLLEAVAAMESHVGDPLSLRQLALVAGITPRHLSRLFRQALGQSVMGYYRDLRLAVGQRLVRDTTMNFSDIADATGFSNAGHFSNRYHARYGQRPQVDRRTGRAARTDTDDMRQLMR